MTAFPLVNSRADSPAHAAAPADGGADVVETARRLGAEVVGPAAADVDRSARFPRESLAALRDARLLGAYVPEALGGLGCDVPTLAALCQALAQHCGATGLIFAMHQIQVACLVHHGLASPFFRDYLAELAQRQLLIASVTSEVGVGGDLRSSIAAVTPEGAGFHVQKEAPTISYGEHADDLLVTARRAPDAAASDQVLVLVRRADATLKRTGDWATLGMRGTCSPGFQLAATGSAAQIVPLPFAEIAAATMVPLSHILWSACWLGIATDAVLRARAFVRAEARRKGDTPAGSVRLAEVYTVLQAMRSNVQQAVRAYTQLADQTDGANEALSSVGFALAMNNLKLSCSQQVVEITSRALSICGMAGYKAGTPFSVERHLRDAYSAGLMIGNERLYATNARLLLIHKDL